MDAVDVAIIGAGVVGAAVAARLSSRSRSCFILERRPKTGGETTERNSGVIHAGLYYPEDSLKTALSVRGNRALYAWAEKANVPHLKTGKLIVATDDEEERIAGELFAHGRRCGVPELEMLSAERLRAIEPLVRGRCALLSGSTGIIDPVALVQSLIASAKAHGAEVIVASEVHAIRAEVDRYDLETTRGPLSARSVVNAAGLWADDIARMAGVTKYTIHPCRGDYYRLKKPLAVRRLVYPVKKASAPGLGVHLTFDVANTMRLGPDARYVGSKRDHAAPPDGLRAEFASRAARFLEGVTIDDLEYDSFGIRPKLRGPTDPAEQDFVIAQDLPRFVNLVGIESPGLTSALAIAEEVERILVSCEI
jgi:L-2-hydroxyglutarate oxidase LhgO